VYLGDIEFFRDGGHNDADGGGDDKDDSGDKDQQPEVTFVK
jgi:hypothetical protein